MGREATLAAVREKYPQYKDMSDDALGSALAAKYPQYADLAPKASVAPVPKPDEHGVVTGAILDTLGLTNRPGAVPLTGAPGTKTPLGVVLKPEGALERAASMMVTAPAIYGAGALVGAAGLPAAAGRIAASGALGAAESKAAGGSAKTGAVVGAATGALSEGLASALVGLPKVGLEATGKAGRGFRNATKMIDDAIDLVKDRMPKGAQSAAWLKIPALNPARPITIEEVRDGLKAARGRDYDLARQQLAYALNEADRVLVKQGVKPLTKPYSGTIMRNFTPDYRVTPSTFSRVADAAMQSEMAGAARPALDALALEPYKGAPFGAIAAATAPGYVAEKAAHLIPHVVLP